MSALRQERTSHLHSITSSARPIHVGGWRRKKCLSRLRLGIPPEPAVFHIVPIASSGAKLADTMTEKVEQRLPVSVVALRAERYSAADDSVVISLRTKYSTAERTYSVPVECLRDLIVDLRRLSLAAPTAPCEKADSQTEPLLPLELPVAAE
jgi:hypothetical protein